MEQNQQKSTKSASKKPFKVSDWVVTLASRLRINRHIELDEFTCNGFINQLIKEDYQEWQANVAELWILKGNWQYKGKNSNILLYNDFFPTENNLKQFSNLVITIKDRDQFIRDHRLSVKSLFTGAFEQWKAQYIIESLENSSLRASGSEILKNGQLMIEHSLTIDKLNAKLLEKELELEQAMAKINRLVDKNIELTRKI